MSKWTLMKRQNAEKENIFNIILQQKKMLDILLTVLGNMSCMLAKLIRIEKNVNKFQDEILYQEARRIVSAEMQNIVYGEYLPTILGVDYMQEYDLVVAEESLYDSSVDPTIFNSFATSAFRFGHSMVNGMFKLISQRQSRQTSG